MDNKNLILVGGGGHCKSVIDVAESAGYNIIGILDKPEKIGEKVLTYKIIGSDNDIPQYAGEAEFIITVGQIKSSTIRQKITKLIEEAGGKFATIIAKDAYISKYTIIGEGTVIMHKAIINAGAIVGKHCIINTMADLEHDVKVGDYCHISTGSIINGDCIIGKNVFIGSHTVLINCISINGNTIVGAGSVVTTSIINAGTYLGNPAKCIK